MKRLTCLLVTLVLLKMSLVMAYYRSTRSHRLIQSEHTSEMGNGIIYIGPDQAVKTEKGYNNTFKRLRRRVEKSRKGESIFCNTNGSKTTFTYRFCVLM